ncbi:Rossmann-fold NAD(P)-binding domain-containing protein [Jatrophihabitans fulvus]
MTFAITGASGNLGRLAAEKLLERVPADQVVLISRTSDKLADLAARGAETREGDFTRPETLPAAFAGVDRLLIISTDAVGSRLEPQIAAVKAAAAAGVQHILYTSIVRPEADNPAAVVPDHVGTEQALRDSGVSWTMLRNNIYSDYQLGTLQQAAESGQLVTNAGEGRVGYVTRDDCAAVAAAVLAGDSTENEVLDVTGPDAVSSADLAALAGRLGDREVTVLPVDDAAYAQGLVEHAGLPEPVAQLLTSFGTSARLGYGDVVTDVVERFTGRPATTLAQLAGVR